MAKEWYRWSDKETAEACLSYLNNHPRLPYESKNHATGKIIPTTKWANEVVECTDGKFGFPRVTSDWIEKLGISSTDVSVFAIRFEPTIETYDPAWIPPSEAELESQDN